VWGERERERERERDVVFFLSILFEIEDWRLLVAGFLRRRVVATGLVG